MQQAGTLWACPEVDVPSDVMAWHIDLEGGVLSCLLFTAKRGLLLQAPFDA